MSYMGPRPITRLVGRLQGQNHNEISDTANGTARAKANGQQAQTTAYFFASILLNNNGHKIGQNMPGPAIPTHALNGLSVAPDTPGPAIPY
jgi:hypothetical protein